MRAGLLVQAHSPPFCRLSLWAAPALALPQAEFLLTWGAF